MYICGMCNIALDDSSPEIKKSARGVICPRNKIHVMTRPRSGWLWGILLFSMMLVAVPLFSLTLSFLLGPNAFWISAALFGLAGAAGLYRGLDYYQKGEPARLLAPYMIGTGLGPLLAVILWVAFVLFGVIIPSKQ